MEVRPILSALWRNKTGPVLIVLQIALTLGVVVNAVFLIDTRLDKMSLSLGIDSENIFSLSSILVTPVPNMYDFIRDDLDAIRAIPGVRSATVMLTVPHSGSARADTYRGTDELNPDLERLANVNFVDEHGLETLGAELIAGRNFRPEEITYLAENEQARVEVVIVSESMGRKLFGEEKDILGQTIYYGPNNEQIRVVGVINDVATAWVAADSEFGRNSLYNFMLQPFIETKTGRGHNYVIRSEPGMQGQVMAAVEATLFERYPDRLVEQIRSHAEVVERSYATDRAITRILSIVAGLMIAITGLGIVGLASFSVNQRQQQIGTRRALGAKRRDIIRYFVLENLLLTTAGMSLGCVLAWLFHQFLFGILPIPTLRLELLPMGAVILYLLGLVAVFGPALRAAAVPPAVASRAV